MVKNPIWSPSNSNTIFLEYVNFLNLNNIYKYSNYKKLHKWSIQNKKLFWKSIWDFTNIIGEFNKPIVENEKSFIDSIFFKNSKLNFTQNILKNKYNNNDAIVFYSEQRTSRRLSWKELNINSNKFSNYLLSKGIKKGDRIAAVLPNIPETVIAFLGTAQIGAIWSSCSADFGASAILDRFKQITPKVLIVSDYYYYNNKKIHTLNKVSELITNISSLENIIIIPYSLEKTEYNIDYKYVNWLSILDDNNSLIKKRTFDFNIPLYILYSSGTTGKPKCIVHGAGGSLIQHKKEHQLHCNIKPNDKVFFFTTCGWMMWNWLISCLASDATIYLYDGSPFYPKKDYLFEIIEKEKITFFGTGAKYLDTLKQNQITINNKYNLKYLKTLASTGSPLMHETFYYVYNNIKSDIHLQSMSGGTDIVSCFVGGNPNLPVYAGEIQCKALGMDVAVFDDNANSLIKKKGELVCLTPFPSKPIYFWNDYNFKKLKKTYFSKYSNIWQHGDFAEITSNEGLIIYGRSDATLNASGIRIGTAELYRVVENINLIDECIAVEQNYKNDTRIILFLKLINNKKLDVNLIHIIKNKIKNSLSPKHVPSKIIQVSDIPRTKSGKIVEITIKKIINNEKITNLSSLNNPESLEEYKNIIELKN